MTRGTLLVYGAGANQVPVLAACRREGWRVVAIDRDPAAPGASLADRFVCASLRDYERIRLEVQDEELSGVVARVTDRVALESSRRVSDARGLCAPCPELMAAATSKVALGELGRSSGLPTPRRYLSGEEIPFGEVAVILRPDVTVRGKAGIRRVDSQSAFEASWSEAAERSANGRVDVSEWIEGADVSVFAQLDRGVARRLAMWDEWVALDTESRVVGMGAGLPSLFESDAAAIDATLDAVAAGFPESRCLITLSVRVDGKGRPWIIEIHLGIGGDEVADVLLPAALPGYDAFESLIRIQTGESWSPPAGQPQPRGLLRGDSAWRLIEAEDADSLRGMARASIPSGWSVPSLGTGSGG